MSRHSFEEFIKEKEEWVSYTKRLEEYFTANRIVEKAKKGAILVSSCGASTYQLVRNLTAPLKPSRKTFKDLVDLVQAHKNPKPSVIMQRNSFHRRQQQDGESIADFVAELRKISEHCGYGETLLENLRDRLVCGLRNSVLQRRLFAEPYLTFERAFSMCQAFEAAERDTRDVQSGLKKSSASVLMVNASRSQGGGVQKSTRPCYRCLGKHYPRDCPFKEATCHYCSKKGHIQSACFAKQEPKKPSEPKKVKVRTVRKVEQGTGEEKCDFSHPGIYTLFHVTDANKSPLIVSVQVQEVQLSMEVDTGAAVSIVSEATYEKFLKEVAPFQPTDVMLKTYTGQNIEVVGQMSVDVQYQSQKASKLQLLVIRGNGLSLLGRDWLSKFTLNWSQLCHVLVLECDASPYGLGAVLLHPGKDGLLQPIAFASRSLAATEKNYSQLEREGLAIMWGVKKLHQYLYGRKFCIFSDHKPLQSILNPSRHISSMASTRTQRWALTLSAYDYSLKYKPGSHLANADFLSRLPLPTAIDEVPKTGEVLHLTEVLGNSPITSSSIRTWTQKDPVLSKVLVYVLQRWPSSVEDAMKTYHRQRDELSVEDNCLLLGSRVVIPESERDHVLMLLHEGHPGMTRMKSLARSIVWWPGIDVAIEEAVS